ncbi:MAG: hypothetical protein ACYCR3_07260, partial [Acidithiobacillus sp.]
ERKTPFRSRRSRLSSRATARNPALRHEPRRFLNGTLGGIMVDDHQMRTGRPCNPSDFVGKRLGNQDV